MDAAAEQPLYLIERGNATSNTESVVILDSTVADTQGSFFLSTTINEAKYLCVQGRQSGFMPVLAEPGQQYRLTGNYNEIWKSKEHLSLTNRLLAGLDSTAKACEQSSSAFADSVLLHQDDPVQQKKFRLAQDINRQTFIMAQYKFIYQHKDNVAAVFTLRQLSSSLTPVGMQRFYTLLKDKFAGHSIMRNIKTVLDVSASQPSPPGK